MINEQCEDVLHKHTWLVAMTKWLISFIDQSTRTKISSASWYRVRLRRIDQHWTAMFVPNCLLLTFHFQSCASLATFLRISLVGVPQTHFELQLAISYLSFLILIVTQWCCFTCGAILACYRKLETSKSLRVVYVNASVYVVTRAAVPSSLRISNVSSSI